MRDWKIFFGFLAALLIAWLVPWSHPRVVGAWTEAFLMLQDYARNHVLLCLIPAFFIAGAVAVFVSQASVLKYFGPQAKKWLSYSIASVSGTILAVCSCTVLPLFAGIYFRGAGIGPASAFLYSGPAINVLAIILTARVLGMELGIARAVCAVLFSLIIGLAMHFLFRKEEAQRESMGEIFLEEDHRDRPLWQTAAYFAVMIGILVFANWGKPANLTVQTTDGRRIEGVRVTETPSILQIKPVEASTLTVSKDKLAEVTYSPGLYTRIYQARFVIAGILLLALLGLLKAWFAPAELQEWGASTWKFTKQIFPLLFGGVLVAGFLLGRPGHESLIPNQWIASLVGGNSLQANLLASVSGALMYFATLTEVPILQGLLGSGMGKGPALALLLAGPALSLPSMIVIRQIMGTKKMLVFVALVVILSTIAGFLYGMLA